MELPLLKFLLTLAFVLAPLMTYAFFLDGSRLYANMHKGALLVLLLGSLTNLSFLAAIWPLFCAFGFLLYLKTTGKNVLTRVGLAGCIPFVFSLISSLWFFAGSNDLHLLGYDREWSFYAALHGAFIGWLFVGCLAFLAKRAESSPVYLWGCYLALVLFLLVAFGIDGVPYIKRIGVVGFSLLVPFSIGRFSFGTEGRSRTLALASLSAIALSMIIAVSNEFWPVLPAKTFDISTMVLTHGLLNAIVAIPCFYLAIRITSRVSPSR